jgi:hypothetical protein
MNESAVVLFESKCVVVMELLLLKQAHPLVNVSMHQNLTHSHGVALHWIYLRGRRGSEGFANYHYRYW